MINIKKFYEFLRGFKWSNQQIDVAHNCLIFGAVLSSKPDNVLELGMGGGYVTTAMLCALNYNGKPFQLTSVDNWHDWKGKEPSHAAGLRKQGVNIVVEDEGRFVRNQPDWKYDFIVLDGDHHRGGEWAEDILRIIHPGGLMFVHDVNMEAYPSLKRYVELSKDYGMSHFIFSKNSRQGEQCNRGLLMAVRR